MKESESMSDETVAAAPTEEPKASRIVRRTAWVNDYTTASYEWQIRRADGSVLDEFDPKLGDGERVLHLISEWPGAPTPASAGFAKAFDENNNEVSVEQFLPRFVATTAFEPYELRAVPRTLDHQKLPDMSIKIGPGVQPIWSHRVRTHRLTGGTQHEEAMIFGARHPDGTEEVHSIYPDGSHFEHSSLDEAHAHVNEATHVA